MLEVSSLPDWHISRDGARQILPLWRIDSPRRETDTRAVELAARIGKNIQAARKARGWSLEKLAARVQPPTGYTQISRLENAQRALTLDWVERIAHALDLDPAELIAGKVEKKPVFILGEQVANEVARTLAEVAIGGEADPGTVQAIALILQELTATFSAHPRAYSDPEFAAPVIALASQRRGLVTN